MLITGPLGRVYPSKQQNVLLFGKHGQEVGGPIHCWSPQPKSWGPVSLGPYGCCAYDPMRREARGAHGTACSR